MIVVPAADDLPSVLKDSFNFCFGLLDVFNSVPDNIESLHMVVEDLPPPCNLFLGL
ncbi:unnamed protein product [Moneuplotes crassus]|uniref:Uncharacterized protein n=1 Tax=Euplotes crassus TaxID=5936 RepID=A0AAD1Y1C4_EUPCR|nr:unnamed protein product [Moneuplotes crassus]